ncbi:MAG: hypothetical protein CMF98_05470 [Candidatus Marinimicrobia bacterium]|nr:hypothetical protein [Candidatus Neomarinimicrobiota bacterium]OUW50104.1 MAG: hypothetical protein CBD50_04005 [bacterium TMED190]|tara:strand:- start:1169 stop:1501 length:333 start_codon:yes stop_codon:yes gene_type:complete
MIDFFDKIPFSNPIILSIFIVLFIITFLSILKKIIKVGIVIFILFIFFMIYSVYTGKDAIEEINAILDQAYEIIEDSISSFGENLKEKTSNAVEEKINNVIDETFNSNKN